MMHIKVFTCAPWNNTRLLGNETDHILRTNSETNFGLLGPRDTFTTPRFFVRAPFVGGGNPEGGY
jgi:hypothetical protein